MNRKQRHPQYAPLKAAYGLVQPRPLSTRSASAVQETGQEILLVSALKGWESPLAQRGLPVSDRRSAGMPPVSATTYRCGERAPYKPALLAQTANFAIRTLPPPSAGIPTDLDRSATGRGLGSGVRVSFVPNRGLSLPIARREGDAKPTKEGRNNSPSLDGGWGVRPTEEAPGSARPQQGTVPTFEVKGTGRARKVPAPYRSARSPKGFPASL